MEHDTSLFFNYASKVVGGALPYQDFSIEYPPLALVFFILPRLVASSLAAYQLAFAVEILIFDCLGLFFLFKLSQRLKVKSYVTLAIYTIIVLAIGPIMINRYDLIPAVMALASLYAFSQGHHKTAWAILAAGTLTKIFPALIAPVFLIYLICQRRYRKAISGVAAMAVTAAIIVIPCLLISPGGFWNSFSMQMNRGLHVESLYSSFLLLGQNLGLTSVRIQMSGHTPISVNAVSPEANALAKIAPAVILIALALVYWLFYRRNRSKIDSNLMDSPDDTIRVIRYSFLAVLVFLLTNSVFSPQYLIWLCPVVPLVIRPRRHVPWIMITLTAMVTYYIYPMHYNGFMRGSAQLNYVLLFRNLLLAALAVWLIVEKRETAAVSQKHPASRLAFKPYALAVSLAVAAVLVLFDQVALNEFTSASQIDSGMPGGGMQPGGGSDNMQGGGFGNNQAGGGPGNTPNNGGPGSGSQRPSGK